MVERGAEGGEAMSETDEERMRRKMQGYGHLAAFLEQHEGAPLDGMIAALNHAIKPHTMSPLQEGWIREGYTIAMARRDDGELI